MPRPGRVLLYAAEDALHIVRRRLDGICDAAGVALADLDIQVITAPTLRLDIDADRASLAETVARLKPRLLILDPFVRLHRIDENASGEVAPLLAYLRDLQRRHGSPCSSSIMPRKAPAVSAPDRRCAAPPSSTPGATPISTCAATETILILTVEHRAASAMPAHRPRAGPARTPRPRTAEAVARPSAAPSPASLDQRIAAALADQQPRPFADLRASCRVRAATLYERLAALTDAGIIAKSADGYHLVSR